MLIESSFDVPAPPEQAWDLLMDVPRVIPCMPGTTLVEAVDASSWKARLDVKLGPVALSFDTDVHREQVNRDELRTTLVARAREVRGRGAGQARIESSLFAENGGTKVLIRTDLTLSGAVAQTGRGLVEAVSAQLVQSFADCLQAQLRGPGPEASAAAAAQAAPIKGHTLALRALAHRFTRFLRRLTGRP